MGPSWSERSVAVKLACVLCVALRARSQAVRQCKIPYRSVVLAPCILCPVANKPSFSFAHHGGVDLRVPEVFRFWLVAREDLQVVQAGERTNAAGKPVSNKILLSIPDHEYNSLRPFLEYVPLPNHLVLHEAGGRLEFAYFPNRGLISLVVVMKDGRTAEAGVVGNEGYTGTPASVGLSRGPLRAVVQVSGDGFRIKVGALRNALESTPDLQMLLNRYAAIRGMQVAQTAACNRLHDIRQRLARWLLMTQDRVDSGSLPITHDFLATMLGTDRPTVSLAAGVLQRKGIIEYTRGAVKIVNRKKLEESACECYGVIRQYDGELGLK